MKRLKRIFALFLIVLVLAAAAHIWYLSGLAAKESYPEDNYLLHAPYKSALIIVAHDDDMAGAAGTMSMLCDHGWNIREMCFYQQGGLWAKKDSLKNPLRKLALEKVAAVQGLSGVDPVDFNFRYDMQQEKSYYPMPYDSMKVNYNQDSLLGYIAAYIEKYKPSVLFTLDPLIGGYGHPDHVMISKLVYEYCMKNQDMPGFPVKKIYQMVFAPSLAEHVIGKMPVYIEAKKVYKQKGMPLPDVQVNIVPYARQKKECLLAYTTEQNSMKKIWPYYRFYPSWLYFRIFDREFFHVIDVNPR